MGGCATKPKVLKDDAPLKAKAPEPETEPHKRDAVDIKPESKVAVAKEEPQGGELGHNPRVHEIVDDDQANKRRSLSLLFKEKENEDGKLSTENEKTALEGTVGQENLEAEKPLEDSKGNETIVKHESLKAEEKLSGESKNNEAVKRECTVFEETAKPETSEAEKPSEENQSNNEPQKEKFLEAKDTFTEESQSNEPIKHEPLEDKSSGSTAEPFEARGKQSGESENKPPEAEKSETPVEGTITAEVVPVLEEKVVEVVKPEPDTESPVKKTEETSSIREDKNRTVVEHASKAADAGSEIR